jgi:uncharacterized membrane protein YdbT with pleckstrin-like domain
VVRATWPALVVVAPVVALAFPTGLAALLVLPLAAGFGELSYRAMGYAVGPAHLMATRAQSCGGPSSSPSSAARAHRVRSSTLQRRLGLATCVVDIAGPGRRPTVRDVRQVTADDIQARVIASVGGR